MIINENCFLLCVTAVEWIVFAAAFQSNLSNLFSCYSFIEWIYEYVIAVFQPA